MLRKTGITLILLALGCAVIHAQSFGSIDNDKAAAETVVDEARGFTAQVDIDTNLFQFTDTKYSDAKQRYKRTDSFVIDNYPFGGFNIFDDTTIAFGYNGGWYGGSLSLDKNGIGGVKAWLGFWNNRIKVSAGNDIGYGYADALGAGAGLRVYDDHTRTNNDGKNDEDDETVDSSKNPDNITQDKGLLVELDLNPVKIAIAGGGNFKDMAKNMGSVMAASNNDPVYGYSMQYGANAGFRFGDYGKINGAWIMQLERDETKFEYNGASDRIIAARPDAEISSHLFGLYGTCYPLGDERLGITVGYAGVFTQYLEEFSVNSETAMPRVFKNGINLMARYKTDTFTVRTDHNFSFWADKNYKIYYLYKPDAQLMKDYGLLAKSNNTSDVSDVSHTFLWNGAGASYRFTETFEGDAYVRNLLRIDETPEYKMAIDYFAVELKSIFHLGPGVECYAGITYNCTIRNASESLPKALGEFGANSPGATIDTRNMVQFPIGMTIKLQK
jgi:hypothetical protein